MSADSSNAGGEAEFRCRSAADHVSAPQISAVGTLGEIGFNGLIAKGFLTLMETFLAAKARFSAADSGIASAPVALSRRPAGCDT
jgi:hypothetical protein